MTERLKRQQMLWQQDTLKKLWVTDQQDDFEKFDALYGDLVQSLDDAYEWIKARTKEGKEGPKTKGKGGSLSAV